MTLKIEPFNRTYFFHLNCTPNLEQYEKIVTWQRNEKIMIKGADGIETDYHFASSDPFDDRPDLVKQREHLWNDYIDICCGDKLQEMLKETGYQHLRLVTLWTQITEGKSWHAPHDHGSMEDGRNWSFVYFVDVDADAGHKGTTFMNPANYDNQFQVEAKTGNMFLWPSNIIHFQPPSFIEKPRKIISGNVEFS
jgi:hypothetical protein